MNTRFHRLLNRVQNWLDNGPRRRTPRPAGARRARLSLDQLENRLVPTVFTVNSLADLSIAGGVDVATGRILGQGNTVTLRSAIEAANQTQGGNTIDLAAPGVYRILLAGAQEDANQTGDFDVLAAPGSSLSIVNTSGSFVAVDGNHLDRVFDINPTNAMTKAAVTLQGFTIENGVASPGDNPTGSGGAIRDQGSVSLTLTNMNVVFNSATADGGGIAMENVVSTPWTLTLNNSFIGYNQAADAGGGVESDGSGHVVLNNTTILGNTSVNQGAGIWIDAIQNGAVFEGASLSVTGSVIDFNRATSAGNFGGGIGNAGNSAVTIANSTIAFNFVNGVGGGFADQNGQGTLTVTGSFFYHNQAATDGGAIAEGGATTSITSSLIESNFAGGNGGAILANGVSLSLQKCTLAYNVALGNGGGIELQTTGAEGLGAIVTDSTLANNYALGHNSTGGAIDGGDAFTGNLFLVNDTINQNFAFNGGGLYWTGMGGAGGIALQNTILARNIALAGPDADLVPTNPIGSFADLGGNLIGVSGPGSGNAGFTDPTTQTGTLLQPLDPRLGPLLNNGGPKVGDAGSVFVLLTEAPLPGSPAIGKGNPLNAPTTDERGLPSVVNGAVNSGAVSQSTGAVVVPPKKRG